MIDRDDRQPVGVGMLRYVLYVADHDIVPVARAFDFFDLCSGHREPVGQLFSWQIEVHVLAEP